MIDRQIDGGDLPQPLAVMVEDWGLSDFLKAIVLEDYGGGINVQESPINTARFYAFHATLGEDSTTTLRALQQYGDEEQAAAAVAWLNEQLEAHWRDIGWGGSATIDQWRSKGSTVYGETTVPGEYVPALVQGN